MAARTTLSARVSEEVREKVLELALLEGVPPGEVVRVALDEFLARRGLESRSPADLFMDSVFDELRAAHGVDLGLSADEVATLRRRAAARVRGAGVSSESFWTSLAGRRTDPRLS